MTLAARIETIVEMACDVRDGERRVAEIGEFVRHNDRRLAAMAGHGLARLATEAGRRAVALRREHPKDNGILAVIHEALNREMPADLRDAVTVQVKRARALGDRVVTVGRAIHDLQMKIIGAIKDLEARSIETDVLDILEAGRRTTGDIIAAVNVRRTDLAEARANWKLGMGSAATWQITNGASCEDVMKALDGLRRLGRVRKRRRLLHKTYWETI